MSDETKIECLGLKHRTYMALKRARLDTVGKILGTGKVYILCLRGIGPVSFEDLQDRLEANGIKREW